MHYIHLDSKSRNTIIRYILYALLGVVILLLTILLTLAAQGYDIDRSTGRLYQNGLVLVQSSPSGSFITLDGNVESPRTPARLAMPEGAHNIRLSQDGYQDWIKDFQLGGSEVLWFYYPLMIPNNLQTTNAQSSSNYSDFSQNPSKSLVTYLEQSNSPTLTTFEGNNIDAAADVVSIPRSIFNRNPANGSLKIDSWAPNNRHLLLNHTLNGRSDFIWVDTQGADNPRNLNNVFNFNFENAQFTDNINEFVTVKNGRLYQGVLTQGDLIAASENNITEFQVASNGETWLLVENGNSKIKRFNGESVEELYETKRTLSALTLGHGRNDRFTSVIRGENEVLLFEELRPSERKNVPDKVFSMDNVQTNSFSEDNDLILVASSSNALTYEIDRKESSRVREQGKLNLSKLRWVGTHHLATVKNSNVLILDPNGDNRYRLTSAQNSTPVYLSQNLESLFTIDRNGSNFSFQVTKLTVE